MKSWEIIEFAHCLVCRLLRKHEEQILQISDIVSTIDDDLLPTSSKKKEANLAREWFFNDSAQEKSR